MSSHAKSPACLLQQRGVTRGDRVIVLAPNSPYWICVFWGTLLCGAVVVPLNIQSTAQMIADIVNHTGAKIIFKYRYLKEALPDGVPVYDIELINADISGINVSAFKKVQASEHDLIEIMYTSGTTGEPKGVMLSHANLYSNVSAIAASIPLSTQDRLLSILPLSHILEQTAGFLLPFTAGACIVFVSTPAAIADLLAEHRITKMVAVPEFLKVMMSKIEERASASRFRSRPCGACRGTSPSSRCNACCSFRSIERSAAGWRPSPAAAHRTMWRWSKSGKRWVSPCYRVTASPKPRPW